MLFFCLQTLLWLALPQSVPAHSQAIVDGGSANIPKNVPASEKFSYSVEWRLIHAGNVRFAWDTKPADLGWRARVSLETVGLVSKLYKVNNEYSSNMSGGLCMENSLLKVSEGSRRRLTTVTYDRNQRRAALVDRDPVKNIDTFSQEVDIEPCEHDVIGALYRLRTMDLEPGRSVQIPVSDGRKAVMVKVESQERETIRTDAGTFKTIRLEAFLFNNVLYRRRGRLLVWLTDDSRHLPVQIRIRLPIYVGTVTLQLQKEGKS